jgi:DNA-binding CsgD family transcriptional regulator
VPPDDPPLVERDSDLASLVKALVLPPAVAVVEGEPGIGKTRLVRQAIAEKALADRQQLLGSARPSLESCPLGPVIEALATANRPRVQGLSALSGVLRTVLPDLADILPPAPPPLEDPQLARHRLVRATAELLSMLGPTVLVLEDLQWVDEATVELLRMISARPPPELSVAITCSSSAALPIPGPTTAHVHLSPLSASAAGRLAGTILGDPETVMPRELVDLLYERNGGVPLVVREDVLLLRQRGLLRLVNGEWSLGSSGEAAVADLSATVPPTVGAEIIARARSLGAAGGSALEAAAVLADSAEPGLVARVTGMDADQTSVALGDATRYGLLRDHSLDSTTIRFRHELARLAIYQAIPGHRRRRLHAVVAQELASTGCDAMVVRAVEHHKHAGDIQGWATSAEAAAEIATTDGSFEAAHANLRDVLQAGAVVEERRAEVAIKLGWAALGGVDRTGATAALLTAAQKRGIASPAQRAELRLLRAWSSLESVGTRQETDAAVGEMCTAMGDLARRPDLHAIALAILAMPTRLPDRDLPMQMSCLNQARAALAQTTDPMAHAVVLTTAAHLLLASGSPQGWPAADAMPTHSDRPDVNRQMIRGLLNLADAALHLGHYSRSLELVERGRRLAADAQSHMYDPQLRASALRVRWRTGDLDAEDQVSGLAGDPDVHGRLHARLLSAQMRTERGRLDVARRTLRAVTEEACGIGEIAIAAHAVAEFNRVALTIAHRRLGHAFARQVLDALAGKQIWVWAAPLLPFIPLDLVRAVLPRYRRGLAGRDAPLAGAALSFAEARVSEQDGDASRASAGYRRARRGYAALPDPRLVAHACASEVRSQISAGQAPDADLLRHAWSTFTGLGAVWDANRLRQLMRMAGLPVPHRRGRPGYGNQLSPREREVADLAASGHTNREIAANLYLSDRTVKYHLANAMRKLEVSSRRQLRDVLEPGSSANGSTQAPRDHTCRCARCGRELNPS